VVIDYDVNTADFRYPVQWVCRPQTQEYHDFRGYMGRIESGEIAVGDEITVLPSGRTSKVKEIDTYDGKLQRAYAPQSVTLTLEDEIDISRGDMFVKNSANPPKVEKEFEAMLCWLSEIPLDKNRKYLVKHTTRTAKCLFSGIDYRVDVNTLAHHETPVLNMNDIARVAMKVQQPLALDHYSKNRSTGSFIVIDEATNNTVAAGMIA
jgi:sulfate adenylyltransferase subunit 1